MEQIARGKWIPLGHQIGFLKHPWSEDYRCSLCGYEAYTIGTPPPEVCPQCHANNTIDLNEVAINAIKAVNSYAGCNGQFFKDLEEELDVALCDIIKDCTDCPRYADDCEGRNDD